MAGANRLATGIFIGSFLSSVSSEDQGFRFFLVPAVSWRHLCASPHCYTDNSPPFCRPERPLRLTGIQHTRHGCLTCVNPLAVV